MKFEGSVARLMGSHWDPHGWQPAQDFFFPDWSSRRGTQIPKKERIPMDLMKFWWQNKRDTKKLDKQQRNFALLL